MTSKPVTSLNSFLLLLVLLGLVVFVALQMVYREQIKERDRVRKKDLQAVWAELGEHKIKFGSYPQELTFPQDPHKEFAYSYSIDQDGIARVYARLEAEGGFGILGQECGEVRCNYYVQGPRE